MGQIAAGDDQRPPPAQLAGQGAGERAPQPAVMAAHHHRHDGHARQHGLGEGHLDLHRVLAAVGRRRIPEPLVGAGQAAGQVAVARGRAQGRGVARARVDGDAVEPGRPVVHAQDDHHVVVAAGGLPPGVGHDLARVRVAGVGRHQRQGPLRACGHGRVQVGLDRGAQLVGVLGIERARHRRRTRQAGRGGGTAGRRAEGHRHHAGHDRHLHGSAPHLGDGGAAVGTVPVAHDGRRRLHARIHPASVAIIDRGGAGGHPGPGPVGGGRLGGKVGDRGRRDQDRSCRIMKPRAKKTSRWKASSPRPSHSTW